MRRLLLLLCLVHCGGPDALEARSGCPGAGSVVITELAIRGAEYVELFNATAASINLDGLTLSVAGTGAPHAAASNGELMAGRYGALPVTALADAGGTVEVTCEGQPIDFVRYARTASDVIALDGAQLPDATFNDPAEHWCAQAGSAGGPNSPCGGGSCDDGAVPHRGDIVISEVMRDPQGADADGEWIELFVAADDAVLLDGLVVKESATSERRFVLTADPCLVARPRELVVLPLGGSERPCLTRGSGLFNDTADLTLLVGEVVLDRAKIACGHDGSSCALVQGEWCEASTPTPGAENVCDS